WSRPQSASDQALQKSDQEPEFGTAVPGAAAPYRSLASLALALVAGLMAGVACISRAAFLPALASLTVGAWCCPPSRQPPADRARLIVMFLVGAILAIAPVTVPNYQIHGRLILVSTNGPSTFLVGHVLHTPFIPQEHTLPNDAEMAELHRSANW